MNCVMCGKKFSVYDLKDELSIREAKISNLCQQCQDSVFAADDEQVLDAETGEEK